ncbi:MAG TPA: STAS domain-containing protein [Gammaproteobacteria bacterium]|nr:STAS domain-containing protein [Gammaproteobacteria bacterium]
MSGANSEGSPLEDLGAGRFALRCDLTFHSATEILSQSKQLFADHSSVVVDMSAVEVADSAGLALLLEWVSWARYYDRKIAYENIPKQLAAIAEISEVTAILDAGSTI